MDVHLKKRLIGAIVTVLLLAVMMPMLLDGTRSKRALPSNIPAQPELQPWQAFEQQQRTRKELEQLNSGESEQAMAMADIDSAPQDVPAPPKAQGDRGTYDDQRLPYVWTLQLGAFEKRLNAHAFRDELRAKGYKAYVQEFATDGLTRVYVGPHIQRRQAEQQQQQLRQALGLKDVYIKRYKAES